MGRYNVEFSIFLMAIVLIIQQADIELMKKDYREDMKLLTSEINKLKKGTVLCLKK